MKKQCELKLVILYDPRNETYTVVEHNLNLQDAVTRAVFLREKHLPAFTVAQTTCHRKLETEQCAACKRDVKRNFAAWPTKPKGEKKTMPESTLKSIIVLDLETHKYKPSGHNLRADEAVNLVHCLTESGRTGKVIDQEARHRAPVPGKCKPCKEAAEKAGNDPEAPAGESAPAASQE